MTKNTIEIYDTTLRDGAQAEGLSYTVNDKIKIAQALDNLGVAYIEGGWPGANPKDIEFFEKIKSVKFKNSLLAAFGSTRRANSKASEDIVVNNLLLADTPIVTIFGKSWDLHVTVALNTTLEENLNMISDTVSFLKSKNRRVFYDAEHFFDGYKANPEYALETISAAAISGAEFVILCDTNGGTLPNEIFEITKTVTSKINVKIGIHCHNDCELGVANSLAAVSAGATQIQGVINGFGERCGNANLTSIIPNLELKFKLKCLPDGHLKYLTETSRYVNEIANLITNERAAYVGQSAFAHKGGIHVSAILKNKETYEHITPEDVGNETRVLVSEQSGVSNIKFKTNNLSSEFEKNPDASKKLLAQLKKLEHEGYQFEFADASFYLQALTALNRKQEFFTLIDYNIWISATGQREASISVKVGDAIEQARSHGDGPVHALDQALRKALLSHYPSLNNFHLVDYKVRILDGKSATAAKTRVNIETTDGKRTWNTVGVGGDIIAASWKALVESLEFGLETKDVNESKAANE